MSRAYFLEKLRRGRKTSPKPEPKTGGDIDWLVVGLGNPGRQYEKTWHNLGFMCLEILSQRHHFRCDKLRFKGLTARVKLYNQNILFLLPQTFMNLSGESVRDWSKYYKVPAERILVIYDDFDLPLGTLRIREFGSGGTHNGMRSIISCLGTDRFPRVRIGFGPKPEHLDIVDYVLHKIPEPLHEAAYDALVRAADAVEMVIREGVTLAMSRMNGKAASSGRHEKKEDEENRSCAQKD